MSTSNMLWNMVKPNSKALYFFGCMTVACAQLSAAGSLATAGGLSATNIPIGEELLEPTTGGRLRHGHRLNRAGRRPRLHTNTSRSYKQLLSYVSKGLQGHLPKNTGLYVLGDRGVADHRRFWTGIMHSILIRP